MGASPPSWVMPTWSPTFFAKRRRGPRHCGHTNPRFFLIFVHGGRRGSGRGRGGACQKLACQELADNLGRRRRAGWVGEQILHEQRRREKQEGRKYHGHACFRPRRSFCAREGARTPNHNKKAPRCRRVFSRNKSKNTRTASDTPGRKCLRVVTAKVLREKKLLPLGMAPLRSLV